MLCPITTVRKTHIKSTDQSQNYFANNLVDPLTGTKEEAQAYENQAIGRAQRQGQTKPVTVVRFVIKNTIEHEFYVRNTGSNQHGKFWRFK